jgi:hypothetical protein
LAWDGENLPGRDEMLRMTAVMCVNDLLSGSEPYRPHLWTIFTARKDEVFSGAFGEVIEKGVHRRPSSDAGASSCAWPTLCLYLDQEYRDDVRVTLDASRKRARRRRFLRRPT